MRDLVERETSLEMGAYSKRPFVVSRGERVFLYDVNGERYLDCVAGHGTANVGHSHPKVVEAVSTQLNRLLSCPEVFPNDVRIKALEKLSSTSGFNKFFLCNSGAESMETALKLARVSTKKTGFICAMNAFHGRTMGAVSLTFKPKYREPFSPLIGPVNRVRFGDASQIREAIDENTAAVVLECIQGEGGVRISPPEYLKEVREICTENDVLLILDEIQTGFGRTGKMFAFENFGIRPDILCMAKSIAGGIPMGATASRDDLVFPPLAHGSTFGGNPVACAGAIAAISAIEEEGMLQNATETGAYFLSRLRELAEKKKQIRQVRGMGLMIAVELKVPIKDALMALFGKKVLVLPGGLQVLRFLPPLVITKEEIDIAVNALEEVLE
jgi:acetylornithine/LysW-gamma-L-lysine aminotransferase